MKYLLVKWAQNNPKFPVLLYGELDGARFENRKVEIYLDGKKGYAGKSEECGETWLGIEPVPHDSEISTDPEFELQEITREEFEKI